MDKWKKLFETLENLRQQDETLSREDSITLSRDNSLRLKKARDRKLGLSFAPKELVFVSITYKSCC